MGYIGLVGGLAVVVGGGGRAFKCEMNNNH